MKKSPMNKSPRVVSAGVENVSGSEASDTDIDKALCQDSVSGARRDNVD